MEEGSPLLLHTASQGYLGVYLGDVDQERAQALHLPSAQGAEITLLDHDAPAAKMGLHIHDVIVEMNGEKIQGADQLRKLLRATPIGHKVQLVVNRDGSPQTVTVQMADRRKVQEDARQQIGSGTYSRPALSFLSGGNSQATDGFHLWGMGNSLNVGALVEPLNAQMADFLGVNSGLMIKSVANKSAAFAAGLKPHDVILEVGAEAIVTSSDWERALRSSEGKPVQVEILRDRSKQLVLLQVDGKRH
jgi:S1-C subfamily serine protease